MQTGIETTIEAISEISFRKWMGGGGKFLPRSSKNSLNNNEGYIV